MASETEKTSVCSGLIFKDVGIGVYSFSALTDTGCDLSLIQNDVLLVLGEFELTKEKRQIFDIGSGTIKTLGSFTSDVELDSESITVKFHVLPEKDLRYGIILKVVDLKPCVQ